MKRWLEQRWYSSSPAPALLKPLAALYGAIAAGRRERMVARAALTKLAVPMIVVGNITVGGTGKTPFVIWLVERLREWGYRPGVISRGYGGSGAIYPLRLNATTKAAQAGDEPALMFQRLRCPLAVAPDRVAAARLLIESGEIDVLISDDGLQHYRLPRNLEICVVDGRRGFGNQALLPAGPLREPISRLQEIDLVVVNGESQIPVEAASALQMSLQLDSARKLADGSSQPLSDFRDGFIHAVAGIGDPERFFLHLEREGLRVVRHAFPDHHAYIPSELAFGDGRPVLMTEKDAVKCQSFAADTWWSVPATAQLSLAQTALVRTFIERLGI